MKRRRHSRILCKAPGLCLLGAMLCPGQSLILDRVAVVVNQQVITETQVIRDLRVAAFLDRRPVDLSGPVKREAAGRLVDQLLMLQEAATSHLALPTIDAASELVNRVRQDYPAPGTWEATLRTYQITERDLALHLLIGLQTLTFTELRFRPGIQIPDADLQEAYERLVPPAERNREGGSFEDSRLQLEELLTGERVIDALDSWLEEARSDLRIRYRRPVFQ